MQVSIKKPRMLNPGRCHDGDIVMLEPIPGASPPVSRRYFYTDPLAAAWMAKHFGMIFLAGEYECRHNSDLSCYDSWPEPDDPDKFYIYPESLPLLEPQVGDVCKIYIGLCEFP